MPAKHTTVSKKSVTAGGQLGTIVPCHASARCSTAAVLHLQSKQPTLTACLLMPVIRLTCSFGNGLPLPRPQSLAMFPRIHCVHTICHERGDV